MVNLVAAQNALLHGLMKMSGVRPHAVEIEPGTVMNFWVPTEAFNNSYWESGGGASRPPDKPAVVLLHGFAAEGIVTWMFQVGALSRDYAVYVPDLLFFGGSTTDSEERSPGFQAECVAKGLRKVGVEECTVVGFSYGGMVAFKMAEHHPRLVRALVISGSVLAMTDAISNTTLQKLGFASSAELLLPTSVGELKALLSVAAHKKLWFPDRLHKDYLEIMFRNRKERGELLDGLIVSNMDTRIPSFSQRIHLLWGEKDQIFNPELAHGMKEQLGELASLEGIERAGHLVQLERPCVYNECLKRFLSSLHLI